MLRPGGVLDISDYDYQTYDADHNVIPIDITAPIGPPYWSRFLAQCRRAVQELGCSTDAATHLHGWIQGHPGFEDVAYNEIWVRAVGPKDELMDDEADAQMRANIRVRVLVSRWSVS